MENNTKLLIGIVNRGFAGDVVAVAREAGAGGATVIAGQGVGSTEKTFMGISLAPEKEMVLILVEESKAQSIQDEVVKAVGLHSSASGICFCLPVDSATYIKKADGADDTK